MTSTVRFKATGAVVFPSGLPFEQRFDPFVADAKAASTSSRLDVLPLVVG